MQNASEQTECITCGKLFSGRKSKQYCSTYCQKRRWQVQHKNTKVELVCEYCNRKFLTGRLHIQRFCSFSCQQKKNSEMHPEWGAARKIKRRAVEQAANVSWANKYEIASVYRLARNRSLVVDHIVPLNSPYVCGLHCEDNLRCIPSKLNLFKSNRYWPDMWEAPRIGNGDGKDIAHTKPGAKGKTFKQSPSANRSFKRTKTARRKS